MIDEEASPEVLVGVLTIQGAGVLAIATAAGAGVLLQGPETLAVLHLSRGLFHQRLGLTPLVLFQDLDFRGDLGIAC